MNFANQVKKRCSGISTTWQKFPGSFQSIPKQILSENVRSTFNPCSISPSVWKQVLSDMNF